MCAGPEERIRSGRGGGGAAGAAEERVTVQAVSSWPTMKRYFHSHFLVSLSLLSRLVLSSPFTIVCHRLHCIFLARQQPLTSHLPRPATAPTGSSSACVSICIRSVSFSPFAHFHTHVSLTTLCLILWHKEPSLVARSQHATGHGNTASIVTCILSRSRFAFRLHFPLLIIATLTVSFPLPLPTQQ